MHNIYTPPRPTGKQKRKKKLVRKKEVNIMKLPSDVSHTLSRYKLLCIDKNIVKSL